MEEAGKSFPDEISCEFCEFRPKVDWTKAAIVSEFHPTKQLTPLNLQNCKKIFLKQIQTRNVSVDELIQPLVSLSYLSSDKEMEVDCPLSTTNEDQEADSDIEVIACYRETSVPIPQMTENRRMTVDLSGCRDNETCSEILLSQGSFFDSEPNNELVNLVQEVHP